ncbi:hypothetical protein GCM10010401_09860 [Rarobacter faecitabidus]|uniref:Carboxypeptidase family protein n=1 Tax=Rarobacter faecitabidus TaxID=13243 RepID=A0A542ZAC6_RARFA|nr:carboxypeptidase-like regulatory domain-containing protein [Rarobacter faecitabidus]TQL57190.1 carboxypeptidase family protein [Rarobacter faecitabidus]
MKIPRIRQIALVAAMSVASLAAAVSVAVPAHAANAVVTFTGTVSIEGVGLAVGNSAGVVVRGTSQSGGSAWVNPGATGSYSASVAVPAGTKIFVDASLSRDDLALTHQSQLHARPGQASAPLEAMGLPYVFAAGAHTVNLDFAFGKLGAIAVTIPAFATNIELLTRGNTPVPASATSQSGQTKTFRGLVPGNYRVAATGTGVYAGARITTDVLVTGGGTTVAALPTPAKASAGLVQGTVTSGGKVRKNVTVNILKANGKSVATTVTDKNGKYSAAVPKSGTYRVRFDAYTAKGLARIKKGVKVTVGKATRVNAALKAGKASLKVTFRDKPKYKDRSYLVKLLDSSGTLVKEKQIERAGKPKTAKTLTASFKSLKAGKYKAIVIFNQKNDSDPTRADKSRAVSVKLRKNATTKIGVIKKFPHTQKPVVFVLPWKVSTVGFHWDRLETPANEAVATEDPASGRKVWYYYPPQAGLKQRLTLEVNYGSKVYRATVKLTEKSAGKRIALKNTKFAVVGQSVAATVVKPDGTALERPAIHTGSPDLQVSWNEKTYGKGIVRFSGTLGRPVTLAVELPDNYYTPTPYYYPVVSPASVSRFSDLKTIKLGAPTDAAAG